MTGAIRPLPGAALRPVVRDDTVTLRQLAWLTLCVTLVLLPHVAALPAWVSLTIAAAAALRLARASRGRGPPPAALRFLVAGAAIGLLLLHYRTFNGRGPGTALLCLIAGLKLLETRTRRDLQVMAMIIFFLSLAALLNGDGFWLLAYLVGVSWLTASLLLRSSPMQGPWVRRGDLGRVARMFAQAAPVALILWLFFPRFDGPLWHLPDDGSGGRSGLSDSMSPGDFSELALSDEIAFRVRFEGPTPPAVERYWRGPVLHDFDGHRWQRADLGPELAPPLRFAGPAYRYQLSLEPSPHGWLFVLDWPAEWSAAGATLTGDYMLTAPGPLSQPIDIQATSYGRARAADPLSSPMRRRDTLLPPARNPRAWRLAQALRRDHPDDAGYVQAVLERFRREPYFYTLTPGRLGADSVDEFLFDSMRGFCAHYASAFAMLMRAAGIPARVVTGYHGGTYNRFAGYWILRQSDAHAWDEVWLEGFGWLRVDPTSAVAPERVERGLNDFAPTGSPLVSRWQQRTPWFADLRLRLDTVRQLWRDRILRYDSGAQIALLARLHIPQPDGQKLALVLAVCLIGAMVWLSWQVRREAATGPGDPLQATFERLCGRLIRIGIERRPCEGALAFAARVSSLRPDLAADVTALCEAYSRLRYGPPVGPRNGAEFAAAVRRFKPRDSPGS